MADFIESIEFTVAPEGAGQRLDSYAALQTEYSRSAVQRLIASGDLLLNGREATLPLEMAAPGSFYRWNDLKTLTGRE